MELKVAGAIPVSFTKHNTTNSLGLNKLVIGTGNCRR